MKLYRRKPEYATAMRVVHDPDGKGGTEFIEYAVQRTDDRGEPLTSHMKFLTAEQFGEEWESFRVRPKPKAKTPPSRSRNGPPKPKKQDDKVEKLTTVNLKDV